MVATSAETGVVSLIDDPVLEVEVKPGSATELSLSGVIALLLVEDDPIRCFRGLAAEQWSHWYRFLVRCATRALRNGVGESGFGSVTVDVLATRIRDALVETAGSEAAWRLHTPEHHEPAFLQSPVFEAGAADDLKKAGYMERPISLLTALLGSKNFERKSEAVQSLSASELVYALVEFQSGVIFGGRGNYETQLTPSRSGKGSGVPFMGLRLPEGLGATFQRDVALFLGAESRIRKDMRIDGDTWALWTESWDGKRSMLSTQLDPAFIPLARMIRLGPPGEDGRYRQLWFRTSSVSRITDVSDGALYGDPFTPTIPNNKAAGGRKVRGVMEGGFPYPEVAELMGLSDREVSPSDTVRAFLEEAGADQRTGIEVVLEGVAFEQGKTLGFYRRVVPLRDAARGAGLFMPDPEPFRATHGRMLAKIQEAKSILRASARMVVGGGPRARTGDEAVAAIPVERLDSFADEGDAYLIRLFEFGRREEAGDTSWDREWAKEVADWARDAFLAVLPLLVAPFGQRYRREAEALNHLEARLWKLQGGAEPLDTKATDEEAET